MTARDAGDRVTAATTTRRTFLSSAVAVPVVSSYSTGPVSGDDGTPQVQPVFSYPTLDGTPDHRHEALLGRLLEQARPDSSVHCSLFTLTRETVVDAFVAAADRGVDVHVLVDERSEDRSATRQLLEALPDTASIVRGGGVGDRLNHNKFLVVDALRNGDSHVVWQSSSNMTAAQLTNHNNSVVVRNDRALYDAYRNYWNDLADPDVQDLSYNRTGESNTATVHFSPRDDFDTHVAALEDVVPSWNGRIYFMQSIWTDSREQESHLVDRLAELVEGGCQVGCIVREDAEVIEALRDAGADVVVYSTDHVGIHSKYMLVDADFETDSGDVERRREVWTGSQNLSRPGLRRNDEALLRFVDDYVFNEYLDDWERVRQQAERARSGAGVGRTAATPRTESRPATAVSTETVDRTRNATAGSSGQSGWSDLARTLGIPATVATAVGGALYKIRRGSQNGD